jgi:hypothetical protein
MQLLIVSIYETSSSRDFLNLKLVNGYIIILSMQEY